MSHPPLLARETSTLAGPLTDVLTGLVKALRRDLARTGMSLAQARVVGALNEHGPLRISDLTAIEQVAQPTMTALITRMQRQGLVTRGGDAEDGRAVVVELTEQGRRAFDQANIVRHVAMSRALDQLHPGDLLAIGTALTALQRLHALTQGSGE